MTFLGDSGLGLIIKFSCWLEVQSFRGSKICVLDHSLGCQQALASYSLWVTSPSSSPRGLLHRVHDGPHDTGFPRVIQTRKRTPKTNAGGCMFVCFNSTVLEVTLAASPRQHFWGHVKFLVCDFLSPPCILCHVELMTLPCHT